MRHKHADTIIAWANGAKIQVKVPRGDWTDCVPQLWGTDSEYRVKPEPKPDVVMYGRIAFDGKDTDWTYTQWTCDNVKVTFDGETVALKSVEILK